MNSVNASQAADVAGFNYQQGQYDKFHAANPDATDDQFGRHFRVHGARRIRQRRQHGTSAAPTTPSARRGAPRTATAGRQIAERPFVAGGFIWTGFDYRGEPTPYKLAHRRLALRVHGPVRISRRWHFTCTRRNGSKTVPVLQLVPHWNWPDSVGKPVKVMALSNADTVALSLNGQPIGEKARG